MRNLCPNLLNLPIFGHGSPDHERRPPFASLAFPKISRKRSRRSSFAARRRHRSSRDVVYVFVRRPIAESRFRAGFVFQFVAEQIGAVRCVVSYGELRFKPVPVFAVVS